VCKLFKCVVNMDGLWMDFYKGLFFPFFFLFCFAELTKILQILVFSTFSSTIFQYQCKISHDVRSVFNFLDHSLRCIIYKFQDWAAHAFQQVIQSFKEDNPTFTLDFSLPTFQWAMSQMLG